MKRSLLLAAALTMVSGTALAQKARNTALQGADHITTTRSIFTNPAYIMSMSDFATFEMGGTPANNSPRAEGGFTRSMGGSKLGFHLGNNSESQVASRIQDANADGDGLDANEIGFLAPENTFEITYGGGEGLKWGASFIYSSSDMKSTEQKQSAMGVRAGAMTDMWEAYVNMGLGSKADGGTINAVYSKDNKYEGKMGMTMGAAYIMDATRLYFKYDMDGYKIKTSAADVVDAEGSDITLGFVNSMKNEGVDFYYGAAYVMENRKEKVGDKKSATSSLPFYIGVEAEAASWVTLRGSVSQNVFMGSRKGNTTLVSTTDKADTIPQNTMTTAGAGFKFGKVNVDTVMGMGTDGVLFSGADDNTFVNSSLTYWF
ncbi:MAG: hypothetical protein AB7O96_01365 [Pseudobdellovibrionaceae bacterium]